MEKNQPSFKSHNRTKPTDIENLPSLRLCDPAKPTVIELSKTNKTDYHWNLVSKRNRLTLKTRKLINKQNWLTLKTYRQKNKGPKPTDTKILPSLRSHDPAKPTVVELSKTNKTDYHWNLVSKRNRLTLKSCKLINKQNWLTLKTYRQKNKGPKPTDTKILPSLRSHDPAKPTVIDIS